MLRGGAKHSPCFPGPHHIILYHLNQKWKISNFLKIFDVIKFSRRGVHSFISMNFRLVTRRTINDAARGCEALSLLPWTSWYHFISFKSKMKNFKIFENFWCHKKIFPEKTSYFFFNEFQIWPHQIEALTYE